MAAENLDRCYLRHLPTPTFVPWTWQRSDGCAGRCAPGPRLDGRQPKVRPAQEGHRRLRLANTVIFGSTGTFGAELFQQTLNNKVLYTPAQCHAASPRSCRARARPSRTTGAASRGSGSPGAVPSRFLSLFLSLCPSLPPFIPLPSSPSPSALVSLT
jgi:hypothetical protein